LSKVFDLLRECCGFFIVFENRYYNVDVDPKEQKKNHMSE